MKTIHTKHAPAAIGPYSQAKQAGGFIFLSGQIGIDPAAGKIIVSDIAGQTEQVCKNIKAILKKAETSKVLDRHLETKIPLEIYDILKEKI